MSGIAPHTDIAHITHITHITHIAHINGKLITVRLTVRFHSEDDAAAADLLMLLHC